MWQAGDTAAHGKKTDNYLIGHRRGRKKEEKTKKILAGKHQGLD